MSLLFNYLKNIGFKDGITCFFIEKHVLYKEEVMKFYANLKFLDGWVISFSVRRVEIVFDPIKLREVLGVYSEGLEEYVWKKDVECLLIKKFTQEKEIKSLEN